jgi:hypothetical protein
MLGDGELDTLPTAHRLTLLPVSPDSHSSGYASG